MPIQTFQSGANPNWFLDAGEPGRIPVRIVHFPGGQEKYRQWDVTRVRTEPGGVRISVLKSVANEGWFLDAGNHAGVPVHINNAGDPRYREWRIIVIDGRVIRFESVANPGWFLDAGNHTDEYPVHINNRGDPGHLNWL